MSEWQQAVHLNAGLTHTAVKSKVTLIAVWCTSGHSKIGQISINTVRQRQKLKSRNTGYTH